MLRGTYGYSNAILNYAGTLDEIKILKFVF